MECRAYVVPDEEEPLLYLDPESVTEVLAQAFCDYVRQHSGAQAYTGPAVLIGRFRGTGTRPTGLYGTFRLGDASYPVEDSVVIYK